MSAHHERVPGVALTCLTLVLVKLALALAGFGRTLIAARWLLRHRPARAAAAAQLAAVSGRVALVAAFFPGRALCLEQSTVIWLLLRARGIEADLRLGVQPYPWGAHAWVEHRGEPVNE
ncbi:MAG TPA: lasso peptide biosynthesis B2 protein, partial [Longimicrobiales bacterium]